MKHVILSYPSIDDAKLDYLVTIVIAKSFYCTFPPLKLVSIQWRDNLTSCSPITFHSMMLYWWSLLNDTGDYKIMIFNIYRSFYIYWLAFFYKENLPLLFFLLPPFPSFVECHYKLMDFFLNSSVVINYCHYYFLMLTFPRDGPVEVSKVLRFTFRSLLYLDFFFFFLNMAIDQRSSLMFFFLI